MARAAANPTDWDRRVGGWPRDVLWPYACARIVGSPALLDRLTEREGRLVDLCLEAGGVVAAATAATTLGVSRGRVHQLERAVWVKLGLVDRVGLDTWRRRVA